MRLRRILVPAQMTGRELARRGFALGLLTALPLAFYGASSSNGTNAVTTGGIAMAFSIAGASIFVALTARPVDQRLVLVGYRPYELLLGRLLLLELFGIVIAGVFSVVMVFGTGPPHPWLLAHSGDRAGAPVLGPTGAAATLGRRGQFSRRRDSIESRLRRRALHRGVLHHAPPRAVKRGCTNSRLITAAATPRRVLLHSVQTRAPSLAVHSIRQPKEAVWA